MKQTRSVKKQNERKEKDLAASHQFENYHFITHHRPARRRFLGGIQTEHYKTNYCLRVCMLDAVVICEPAGEYMKMECSERGPGLENGEW